MALITYGSRATAGAPGKSLVCKGKSLPAGGDYAAHPITSFTASSTAGQREFIVSATGMGRPGTDTRALQVLADLTVRRVRALLTGLLASMEGPDELTRLPTEAQLGVFFHTAA